MRKTGKFLTAVLAAAIAVPMGTTSVSAERSHDLVDLNKLVFSVKDDNPVGLSYEYEEFVIDENYNINHVFTYKPTSVVVRMTDGSKPETDGNLEVSKLSKYQIRNMQIGGKWASFYDMNLDINDDLYYITGFENSEDTEPYCTEILESGKADYAKPVSYIEYGVAYPAGIGIADYLKENGVNSADFSEDLFGFTLTFDNAEAAKSFEADSIKDFAENLSACAINGNVMYFQLKEEAEGEIMTNVLCALQETETINKIGIMPYSTLESTVETAGGIPKNYAMGDTDYNDAVDLYDAINIAKHIAGTEKLDEMQLLLVDCDDNGKIDLYDAIYVAECMIGKHK